MTDKKGALPTRPMRAGRVTRNPFLNFMRDFRRSHNGVRLVELSKRGAEVWKKMNDRQKSPYCQLARQAPKRRNKSKKRKKKKQRRRREDSYTSNSDTSLEERKSEKAHRRERKDRRKDDTKDDRADDKKRSSDKCSNKDTRESKTRDVERKCSNNQQDHRLENMD